MENNNLEVLDITKDFLKKHISQYELDLLNDWVVSIDYTKQGKKTTTVLLTLFTGFEVTGTSACANPDEYSLELGVAYAVQDALLSLDEFNVFLKQWMDCMEKAIKEEEK